jgi:TPR repeat protein
MLLRRGHSLLELGDISGARRFLERAEAGGSAEAARALAETYDPRTLAGFRTRGLQPDPLAALAWYRRAAALGAAVGPQIAALESSR